MKRTDGLDIKSGCLLQEGGCLCAVLSYYVKVISSRLACPVLIGIQSSEFTEGVCREEYFLTGFICNHYFRPVDHWRHNESQGMGSQLQCVPLGYYNLSIFDIHFKKLWEHVEQLRITHQFHIRIFFSHRLNAAAVIRFQMRDYQVCRIFTGQFPFYIGKPFISFSGIHRVHNGSFIIHYNI